MPLELKLQHRTMPLGASLKPAFNPVVIINQKQYRGAQGARPAAAYRPRQGLRANAGTLTRCAATEPVRDNELSPQCMLRAFCAALAAVTLVRVLCART